MPPLGEDQEQPVHIPARNVVLEGELSVPPEARGLVLFAHGSGSSRHSPRNRYVAQALQQAHLATLLIDLLTPQEEKVDNITAELRFNISLLGTRLVSICDWLVNNHFTRALQIGCFGASTGAGAALMAAAKRPLTIAAVVSRGGRPDLAARALPRVQAPTLLIVGSNDLAVIKLNFEALAQLTCEKKLAIVPGAGHLFEEPGALEQVAQLARDWFLRHLAAAETRAA